MRGSVTTPRLDLQERDLSAMLMPGEAGEYLIALTRLPSAALNLCRARSAGSRSYQRQLDGRRAVLRYQDTACRRACGGRQVGQQGATWLCHQGRWRRRASGRLAAGMGGSFAFVSGWVQASGAASAGPSWRLRPSPRPFASSERLAA